MNQKSLPEIYRKTLLYKSGVEYADYCINHIEGCSHGCRYPCYAMVMKRRCGVIKDYQDWIQPKIVANALELLDKEIPKYKYKIKVVHLCFTTDPFMYRQPEVIELTLKIISRLNEDGIHCTVLTKGLYSEDLLDKEKYGINNEYGITLVSIDSKFKSKFEPYSAPFLERIRALKKLHEQGLKTWVSMEPYPTPNLVEQNLEELLLELSFVDKIIFGKLNYNTRSSNFKDSQEFYNDCAYTVSNFCITNGIDYHIKFGTCTKKQYLDDKNKTERIFTKKEIINVDDYKIVSIPLFSSFA